MIGFREDPHSPSRSLEVLSHEHHAVLPMVLVPLADHQKAIARSNVGEPGKGAALPGPIAASAMTSSRNFASGLFAYSERLATPRLWATANIGKGPCCLRTAAICAVDGRHSIEGIVQTHHGAMCANTYVAGKARRNNCETSAAQRFRQGVEESGTPGITARAVKHESNRPGPPTSRNDVERSATRHPLSHLRQLPAAASITGANRRVSSSESINNAPSSPLRAWGRCRL